MISNIKKILAAGLAFELMEEKQPADSPRKMSGKVSRKGVIFSEASHAQQVAGRLGQRQINDAISFLQTADSSASSLQEMLKHIEELLSKEGDFFGEEKVSLKSELKKLVRKFNKVMTSEEFNQMEYFRLEAPILSYIGQGFFIDIKKGELSFDFEKFVIENDQAEAEIKRQMERVEKYREALGVEKGALEVAAKAMHDLKECQNSNTLKLPEDDSAEKLVKNVLKAIVEEASFFSRSHGKINPETVLNLINTG